MIIKRLILSEFGKVLLLKGQFIYIILYYIHLPRSFRTFPTQRIIVCIQESV